MNLPIELPDERYAGQVLEHDLEAAPVKPHQPFSEVIQDIWGDMPEDARAELPRDGASQIDHYVYGLPKTGY